MTIKAKRLAVSDKKDVPHVHAGASPTVTIVL